jgi:hypothetical protein
LLSLRVSERSGLDLSPKLDLRSAPAPRAAARQSDSASMTQVIDLIDSLHLLRKRARKLVRRRIKQLARFLAGSAQSYPQEAWKAWKVLANQSLAGIPSHHVELWRLSLRRCAA